MNGSSGNRFIWELNDYQVEALKTRLPTPLFYRNSEGKMVEVPFMYSALGLGEAGEVQNKVKKIVRDADGVISEKTRAAICGELGGVLWYVAACAADFGLTLSDVATENIIQLQGRRERGTLKGSGDDR